MSIKRNLLYNTIYQILLFILPLITTPYVSRVIGAEGVGTYSYTYSIANYFVIIAMLGINNYGNRSIAGVRDDRKKLNETFSSLLVFHFITAIVMILIYSIYIIFFVSYNKIIFVIQILYVVSSMFDINWFFFGMEQFRLTVTRNIIIKLLSVIFIFIFVKTKNDLWIYSLILSSSAFISQCLLWPFIRKFVSLKKITFKDVIGHLKPCSVLFIPVIAVSIYKIMDKIMLGSMNNMIEVGFYENSEKIINIPIGIITALGTVMLPRMANLKARGFSKESEKYIDISMQFAMFISIGTIFGLVGVAPILIPIFLGTEFLECINIVSLLSITVIFISWANVIRTQYVIPNKLDKIHVISTGLGAMVNLFVNLLLIRNYGAIGATIGTILAEFSVAYYVTIKIKNRLPIKKYMKNSIPFIISGLIMFITIKIIGYIFNNKTIIIGIVQVIVGGSVYLILVFYYFIKSNNKIGLYIKDTINAISKRIVRSN